MIMYSIVAQECCCNKHIAYFIYSSYLVQYQPDMTCKVAISLGILAPDSTHPISAICIDKFG